MTSVKNQIWISTLILLGIAALIFSQFPHDSLWYDETVNAYLATSSWDTLWEWSTEIDNQLPLHFVALKLWGEAAGTSEFSLRLFSAFCGLLAAAATIILGRQLTRYALAGWLATIYLAFSGGFLYAVGEVRTYALSLALLAWSTSLLIRMLRVRRWWPLYTIITLLLLFSHYTALAAIGVHLATVGLWFLRHPRQRMIRGIAVPLIITGAFAVWVLALGGRDFNEGTAFPGEVGPQTALDTYVSFYVFGQRIVSDYTVAYVITVYVGLAGTLWLYLDSQRRNVLLAVALVLIPLGGLLIAVTQIEAKLSGRHAWMTWMAVALLLGGGVSHLIMRLWHSRFIIVVLSLILPIIAFVQRGDLEKQFRGDFRRAFAIIEGNAGHDDVLILRDGTLFTAAEYYDSPIPYTGVPESAITNVDHLVEFHEAMDQFNQATTTDTKTMWVMSWQGDTMDPAELAYGIPEYLSDGQVKIWMPPAPVGEPSSVSLFSYTVDPNKQPLFEHIMDFDGLLQVSTDGPSLLGYDAYYSIDTCQAIVHTWWWRGDRDYPETMLSARVYSEQEVLIDIQDQPLANYGFEQNHWTMVTPTLARQVLDLPCITDIETVRMELIVYDSGDNNPPQQLDLRLQ